MLEVPFVFDGMVPANPVSVAERDDLGLLLAVEDGRITEVALRVSNDWHDALVERWGSAREDDHGWTWRLHNRVITQPYSGWERITIRKR